MIPPKMPDDAIIRNNAKEIDNLRAFSKEEGQVVERLFMNAITGELTNEIGHQRSFTEDRWHIIHVVFDEGDVELKDIEHQDLSEQARSIVNQTQQILKIRGSGQEVQPDA